MPEMRGASFSFIARNVKTGETLYEYDSERNLTPASVMKLVTTATALELLGGDYRFATVIEHDGEITDGVLNGNIYIRGSGDPTLGSSFFSKNTFLPQWVSALKKAGIHSVEGKIIADESIFDSEGLSGKILYEDMGSYYGAGSYGLNVFDNQYKMLLQTKEAGSKAEIKETIPALYGMAFHNYMTAANISTDSSLIMGAPFVNERYLYGSLPANRETFTLKGDIPDPALFLAQYFTESVRQAGINISEEATCYRILKVQGLWKENRRTELTVTYSPPLQNIVNITNEVSNNLYADAILKTVGLTYRPKSGEKISSFHKGLNVLRGYWTDRGVDVSSLHLFDGSGLAVTNKITTAFLCDLLVYMHEKSTVSDVFVSSIPQAGIKGSVRNFLKGSYLQGSARLKSGGMSAVRSFAGYIEKDGNKYAVVVIVNNYSGKMRPMTNALERLLLSLF